MTDDSPGSCHASRNLESQFNLNMFNKRENYESLETTRGPDEEQQRQQPTTSLEAPVSWASKNRVVLLAGLSLFLFFGLLTSGGTQRSDTATLGAEEDSTLNFCCYYSTDKADACGTCKSKEDSMDWCSASESKCLDCGGTFCPASVAVASDDDKSSDSGDDDSDDGEKKTSDSTDDGSATTGNDNGGDDDDDDDDKGAGDSSSGDDSASTPPSDNKAPPDP